VADDAVLELRLDHGPGSENDAVNFAAHDLLVVGELVKRPGQVIAAADENPSGIDAAVLNHVNTVGLGVEGEKSVKVSRLGVRPMEVASSF
jgi:hypothetical protein